MKHGICYQFRLALHFILTHASTSLRVTVRLSEVEVCFLTKRHWIWYFANRDKHFIEELKPLVHLDTTNPLTEVTGNKINSISLLSSSALQAVWKSVPTALPLNPLKGTLRTQWFLGCSSPAGGPGVKKKNMSSNTLFWRSVMLTSFKQPGILNTNYSDFINELQELGKTSNLLTLRNAKGFKSS